MKVRVARMANVDPHVAVSGAPQLAQEVHRERKDDRGRALAGDVLQPLEVAKLHRFGPLRQDLAGLRQLLGRLQLAFGVDHLGAPHALGLRLLGDRPHHRLVDVDVLELDVSDLDTPGISLLVEDLSDIVVELGAFRQHLVEVVLTEHGT